MAYEESKDQVRTVLFPFFFAHFELSDAKLIACMIKNFEGKKSQGVYLLACTYQDALT